MSAKIWLGAALVTLASSACSKAERSDAPADEVISREVVSQESEVAGAPVADAPVAEAPEAEAQGGPVVVANVQKDTAQKDSDAPAPKAEPKEQDAGPVEPTPSNLTIEVAKAKDGVKLTANRPDHFVYLRSADGKLQIGDGVRTSLDLPEDATSAPVILEMTSKSSLETSRAHVVLTRDGDSWKSSVAMQPKPNVVDKHDALQHRCVAHEDGLGSFAVMCSFPHAVTSASIVGDGGAWNSTGWFEPVMRVSVQKPSEDAPVASRLIGYVSNGKGVVVHVQATQLEGEKFASFAIGSDSRAQIVQQVFNEWGGSPRVFDTTF